MSVRPCENCHGLSRVVESESHDATVLTVRCSNCGLVWTVQKSDPGGPTTNVTLPRKN
jgi:predicted Zn finger-like uncharacterized protein